ncbi:uncharacterized protein BT62DRAFT_938222 [Guyanagaster necrorhizus]|uniref:Uncharacterized protein n=1 Tax=Guyanagaster necrorhizus TaxID=856835 RepID=A0A9P7VH47_9AGAR|nr:uncharacterized protein BT62DRAFT_938222 [Guyanagaster necrorhizus MCA 3950]KAG7440265.1 hypothetical protein BT62DRAFT_938222 [Guyanagaster necrorhizus MCA 3950]
MGETFGEDSDAYKLVVTEEKLVAYRLTNVMIFRLLIYFFWLSPFLLWFLSWIKA